MFDTQLVSLLKTFSAYEMNSFRKFVISPFFNKNVKVISLFNILEKAHPGFNDESLKKVRVYKEVFPKEKYDDVKMRHITYELLKLAEEFLGIVNFRENKLKKNFHILEGLLYKKQNKMVEKLLKRLDAEITTSEYASNEYFYSRHLLSGKKNYYKVFVLGKESIVQIEDFIEEGESAIIYLLHTLYSTVYNVLVFRSVYNRKPGFNILFEFINNLNLENIIKIAKVSNYKNYIWLEFYYNMIMMSIKPDKSEYYYFLKHSIDSYVKILNHYDLYQLLNAICSYNIEREMRDKKSYNEEQFDIYKKMLQYKVYTAGDEYFHHFVFSSICRTAIALHEYDWTIGFINKYEKELNPALRESTVNISSAVLNFAKGNYHKVLNNLQKVKLNDSPDKFTIKDMTLKSYYELGEYEGAIDSISSYRHFLSKNKNISIVRKRNCVNFLDFTARLLKIKSSHSAITREAFTDLRSEIERKPELLQRKWLLEKLAELNK